MPLSHLTKMKISQVSLSLSFLKIIILLLSTLNQKKYEFTTINNYINHSQLNLRKLIGLTYGLF